MFKLLFAAKLYYLWVINNLTLFAAGVLQVIRRYWKQLVGDKSRFSPESRIFHAISISILFLIAIGTLFNLAMRLYVPALITGSVIVIQSVLYYQSRIKHRLNMAVTLSAVEIIVFNALAYFFNGGLNGSVLFAFVTAQFVMLMVVKQKQALMWFFINLLAVTGIVLTEYFHPEFIEPYSSREVQFMDMMGSYLIMMATVYVCTLQIRKSHATQKRIADERTSALQLLNAEKDKLFSIIAHDLQSPLAAVKQYLDVLTHVKLDADERLHLEAGLSKHINSTQYLLNNLLKWAKNQMQSARVNLQPVVLAPLLNENLKIYEHIAAEKGIKLSVKADEHLKVKADADMLQIIVRNLLNNAIKFTPTFGEIHVTAAAGDKHNGLIAVTDNGIGIPEHKQKDIFSLKADSTFGTANEKGTGLGLVLCRDYTLLQGGEISFISRPSQGTTFYVSLPLAEN